MGILINAVASFGFFYRIPALVLDIYHYINGSDPFDDDVNQAFVNSSSSAVNSLRERMSFLGNLTSKAPSGGLVSGLFLGMSLGVLWIPCVGPILEQCSHSCNLAPEGLTSYIALFFLSYIR